MFFKAALRPIKQKLKLNIQEGRVFKDFGPVFSNFTRRALMQDKIFLLKVQICLKRNALFKKGCLNKTITRSSIVLFFCFFPHILHMLLLFIYAYFNNVCQNSSTIIIFFFPLIVILDCTQLKRMLLYFRFIFVHIFFFWMTAKIAFSQGTVFCLSTQICFVGNLISI